MGNIVLVIDDDATCIKQVSRVLKEEYRVAAAKSGEAAFKYLEKNRPDLILLDLTMPDMDGTEVMKRLQANEAYKEIPVILLSGLDPDELELKCHETGAVGFAEKPCVPAALLSCVSSTLEEYSK